MGARRLPSSLLDRILHLRNVREELEAEIRRLSREEEYLGEQVRKAREQLGYYERLLRDLKKEVGREQGVTEILRRMA